MHVGAGLVANLPARNPLITASLASTLSLVTNGRFTLGVGRGQDRLADMLGVPHSNFALIERYLTHLRSDVRTLFRTSNSLVEKINAMDPFEEIPLPLPS